MIISQQVELFTVMQSHSGSSESADENGDGNESGNEEKRNMEGPPDFSLLLRHRLCPVLSIMLASEFVIGLESTGNNKEGMRGRADSKSSNNGSGGNRRRRQMEKSKKGRIVCDNPASFTLLMTLTKLAATIITVFRTHSALASSLDLECHVLLVSLVKYVKAATEVIHDSHEFEVR